MNTNQSDQDIEDFKKAVGAPTTSHLGWRLALRFAITLGLMLVLPMTGVFDFVRLVLSLALLVNVAFALAKRRVSA